MYSWIRNIVRERTSQARHISKRRLYFDNFSTVVCKKFCAVWTRNALRKIQNTQSLKWTMVNHVCISLG